MDGAGKTRLAEEVAQELTARRRPAVRITLDQFEQPTADGVFLQRPELTDLWDATVWVEDELDVAARRGVDRNLVWFDSLDETHERYRTRYLPALRRYIEEQRPRERATFVFRNTDLTEPELVTNRN